MGPRPNSPRMIRAEWAVNQVYVGEFHLRRKDSVSGDLFWGSMHSSHENRVDIGLTKLRLSVKNKNRRQFHPRILRSSARKQKIPRITATPPPLIRLAAEGCHAMLNSW